MRNWRDDILNAPNLVSLCAALNEMEQQFRQEAIESGQPACVLAGISENELCDLPTFGGNDWGDGTVPGVFSWDDNRVLRSDGNFPYIWYLDAK